MQTKIPVNQVPEQGDAAQDVFVRTAPSLGAALFKSSHEDFRVEEILPFAPGGAGKHLLLFVRQDGWNSAAAARWLARAIGCRARDVGYCGHKDRHAVTVQAFSVPSKIAPDAAAGLDWPDGLSLVSSHRHHRKLRRGAHRGNRFEIVLRGVEADPAAVEARLCDLAVRGFANYFGRQRFGRDGANVARARAALDSDDYRRVADGGRSVQISSLRSMLFNSVLAARVSNDSWMKPLADDLMILDGTRSFFVARADDDDVAKRLARGDVHVSGPLWGIGSEDLPPQLAARERHLLAGFADDCRLLEARGFALERRALRAPARALRWCWREAGVLELAFELGRGSYATAFLTELFDLREPPPAV